MGGGAAPENPPPRAPPPPNPAPLHSVRTASPQSPHPAPHLGVPKTPDSVTLHWWGCPDLRPHTLPHIWGSLRAPTPHPNLSRDTQP